MLYLAKRDGRITDPIWIKIKSSTLLGEDVRFCSDVSNKSGVPILTAQEAEHAIDFEVLFTRMDWQDPEIYERRKAAVKSEILIPRYIPSDQILSLENG